MVHTGLKALSGSATGNSKEPATEGLAEGDVLEGSFLACPLLMFTMNLNQASCNPFSWHPGGAGEGPTLLLKGGHGQVAPKPSQLARRDSAFQT